MLSAHCPECGDLKINCQKIHLQEGWLFFLNDSQLSWLVHTSELIHSFACNFIKMMIIIIKFGVMTKKTISCNAKAKNVLLLFKLHGCFSGFRDSVKNPANRHQPDNCRMI